MLQGLIFFECICIILSITSFRVNKHLDMIVFLLLTITSFAIYKTVSFGQLIISPQLTLSDGITNATGEMLDCLHDYYPLIDTEGLKQCVFGSNIYNVSKGRIPYVGDVPIAFVIVNLFDNKVFVVDDYYSKQNDINQALILIHECSHLVLSTIDYAYRWQAEFYTLSDSQHLKNADSYVDLIVNKCLTDIDVSFY